MNRKLTTIIVALTIVMTTITIAEARHRDGLDGLLLGSAGGAVIGHAIDRSPEGAIIGSVIGGTLGILLDLGSNRGHAMIIDGRRHQPRASFVYNSHRNNRHDRWNNRKNRRHERRWRQERRHHRR